MKIKLFADRNMFVFLKITNVTRNETTEQTINLPKTIKAPVSEGQIVGNITFTLNGEILGECDLISDKFVDSIKIFSMEKLVLNKWFSVLRKTS